MAECFDLSKAVLANKQAASFSFSSILIALSAVSYIEMFEPLWFNTPAIC